ncbi:MAG: thiosulfate oxidation carrier complex protein SoxZ [Gammaproteobacteria bacterium]|nr:thiosulfate oxidation carrier complex protein SoxZ [Gammaproteobacteria bacterium]MBU1775420.1 thiosulfate oxidation carrier complex protein SoxZ [Gammaproteobacteria bacterium]MBU1969931.1 thiosulfate oxidation carrier complex protein SoxZ [Gammaproteobacteria bacterium]
MGKPMKIRASVKDGVTEVKVLMQHEMETGLRKEADGSLVPAWFITEVKAQHQGRTVLEAQYGQSISKNPYLMFRFKGGAAGEKVTVTWVDNKGDTRTDEVAISA